MADRVVDLEQRRDSDLEELEARLRSGMTDATNENRHLKERLAATLPQISQLKQDCLYVLATD